MISGNVRAKCKAIAKQYYPTAEWPGVVVRNTIISLGGPDRVLLELGCGREARHLKRVAHSYHRSIGVDLETARYDDSNRRWHLIGGDVHQIPLCDNSVDVVTMIDVTEHLERPHEDFVACARVLRLGGCLVVSTVNKRFPPIILGRALPHRVRQWLNRIATGTKEEETFPAFYRANSVRALVEQGQKVGFLSQEVRYLSTSPQYLAFSVLAYRIGVRIEQFKRKHECLRHLRHFLLVTFQLPSNGVSTGENTL